MTIEARVIADSIYENGPRLTTFQLKYPRFIHAELMTHRVFSRNAASSRAIPIKTMIQRVKDDPAMPVWWGKNQPGMQAKEELSDKPQDVKGWYGLPSPKADAMATWLRGRDRAIETVEELMEIGLHKQISNRPLEPWSHIEVVLTTSRHSNHYGLRDHGEAQPEYQDLAGKMLNAHQASTPEVLTPGEWHLPYIVDADYEWAFENEFGDKVSRTLQKISAARCARVSYLKHDSTKATVDEDLAMFDRLMGGSVKHASPTEHQARVPLSREEYGDEEWHTQNGVLRPELVSNLAGWVQFRKLIPGEHIDEHKGFRG